MDTGHLGDLRELTASPRTSTAPMPIAARNPPTEAAAGGLPTASETQAKTPTMTDAPVTEPTLRARVTKPAATPTAGPRAIPDAVATPRRPMARPTLELLLAIARAHRVPLDDLVGLPDDLDPRIRLEPRRVGGRTVIPLSRSGSTQAWQIGIPASAEKPDLRRHDGSEWLYVLSGELRLILGSQDLVLQAGEAAEFDTQTPHRFGGTGRSRTQILSLFNRAGTRVHVQGES